MRASLINSKKSTGLDNLFKDYIPQQLEEPIGKPSSSNPLHELMKKYEHHLKIATEPSLEELYAYSLDDMAAVDDILTPDQIAQFFTLLIHYENHPSTHILTRFTHQLLRNSYQAGHNNFRLDVTSFANQPLGLCSRLEGTEQNPLCVGLYGKITGEVGFFSSQVQVSFRDDFKAIGLPALEASDSTFIFHGSAGDIKNRTTVYSHRANRCKYKTTNKQTLEQLRPRISPENGNTLYFIHENLEEELIEVMK